MNFVKLSIIIPVYNNFDHLKSCLQSIAEQSFKDYEIIIVNDGSNKKIDFSKFQIPGLFLARPRNSKFYYIEHGGAPRARNFGFEKSSGEYLFFCDADVEFLDKNALQKMIDILDNNPDKAFVYSKFKFGWKTFKSFPFDAEKFKKISYISTMSMLRRKYFFGWDESLKKFQDWDLWLTIVERGGKGMFIPEVLWQAKTKGTMSKWLPSIFYKFKFLKSVKEFERYKEIVKKKHGLK